MSYDRVRIAGDNLPLYFPNPGMKSLRPVTTYKYIHRVRVAEMIVPDLSRVLGTEILGESRHVPLQALYIVQRSNMETSPSISIIQSLPGKPFGPVPAALNRLEVYIRSRRYGSLSCMFLLDSLSAL